MRKRLTAVFLLAASGCAASAAEKTEVVVYMNRWDASEQLLGPGKVLVSAIFDQISVHLVSHMGDLPSRLENAGPAVAIRTAEHPPESAASDTLAYPRIAGSKGVEIVVFKDRLEHLLALHRTIARVAAAYVLAHELAHMMQGVPRLSDAGILKAHWGEEDYHDMAFYADGVFQVDLLVPSHLSLTL